MNTRGVRRHVLYVVASLVGLFNLILPCFAVNYTVSLKTTRCINSCDDNLYDDGRTCPSSIMVDGEEMSLQKDGFNYLSLPSKRNSFYRWFDANEKTRYAMFKRLFTGLEPNSIVFIVLQNMCGSFDKFWYKKLVDDEDVGLTLKVPNDENAPYNSAVVIACNFDCDFRVFMKTFYAFNKKEYSTTFDVSLIPVKPEEKKGGNGILIAVIVVILLLVIIISAGIFVYRRSQKNKKRRPPSYNSHVKSHDVADGVQYRNDSVKLSNNKDSEEQNYLVPSNVPKQDEQQYVNVKNFSDSYDDEYERMDANEYAEPRTDGRFDDGDDDVYVNMTPDTFARKNTDKSKVSEFSDDDPYETMDGNTDDYERMGANTDDYEKMGGSDEYERMDMYRGETVF